MTAPLWPASGDASALGQLWQEAEATVAERRADGPALHLSLGEFIRDAWHVVEPSTPYVANWHIGAIVEHLEAVTAWEIDNLLINIPPRHMKSLAVSVFWPAWVWTRDPAFRWLFASYAQSLSNRDSLKCRRLVSSPWYQQRWGRLFRLTGDQNMKTRFENDRTGYRISTSVGGAATGEGGDVVACDDPHSVKERESDAKREAVLDWWDNVMHNRAGRYPTPRRVIVMQRVHERDLSGHVMEQGGYVHLCLPAEYEPRVQVGGTAENALGWKDPRTKAGELLWPQRFGPAEISGEKKVLGSQGYAGQYQQRPSPSEGGIFKRHWWRYWQPAGANLPPVPVKLPDSAGSFGAMRFVEAVPLPARFTREAQSWDMAFKGKEDSDFVCGQFWGATEADAYLQDQDMRRLDFPATIEAVQSFTKRHPTAGAKWVEDKANGPAVIATLHAKIPGMIAVPPDGDKQARAHAVSPYVESGNVYLPHPALFPWVEKLIESCAAFPNAANDDDVDALTQALRKLLGGSRPRNLTSYPTIQR